VPAPAARPSRTFFPIFGGGGGGAPMPIEPREGGGNR